MIDRAALLNALLSDPMRARLVPRADAEALLVELARVQRALELLAVNGTAPAAGAEPPSPSSRLAPRMLTLEEAAERSGLGRRWFVEHWKRDLPFAVKKGRAILFPETEFERWLKRR